VVVCSGLHPSQQLMKYDGEMPEDDRTVAQRLSSHGSGGSADSQQQRAITSTDFISDDAASPPTEKPPVSDVSELYTKPNRVIGRLEAEAEPSAVNDQIAAAYSYEDQDYGDRKQSLTGDLTVLCLILFVFLLCLVYIVFIMFALGVFAVYWVIGGKVVKPLMLVLLQQFPKSGDTSFCANLN